MGGWPNHIIVVVVAGSDGEAVGAAQGEALHGGGDGAGRHHGRLRRPHRPIRPRRRPLRRQRALLSHPHRRLRRGRRRRHLHGPRRVGNFFRRPLLGCCFNVFTRSYTYTFSEYNSDLLRIFLSPCYYPNY